MSDSEILDVLPLDEPSDEAARAAALLEEAWGLGLHEPHVARLLSVAYRRQDRLAEARAALERSVESGVEVHKEKGLLALAEANLPVAEAEWTRAWQSDPGNAEVAYYLVQTRLRLGSADGCDELLAQARGESLDPEGQRLLEMLRCLLLRLRGEEENTLSTLDSDDETRLIRCCQGLGQPELSYRLMCAIGAARPESAAVQEAIVQAGLAAAHGHFQRGAWTQARRLLEPLPALRAITASTRVALLNLLGCSECLTQDPEDGARHFAAALKLNPGDARLHQNLALAYELQEDLPRADAHWNKYYDHLSPRMPTAPGEKGYCDHLAFQSRLRLATLYYDRERWSSAIVYFEQASKLRPDDVSTLEKLLTCYTQAGCREEARHTLRRLRKVRPDDPQLEFSELELTEVRDPADLEDLLEGYARLRKEHPDDAQVVSRGADLLSQVGRLLEGLTDQLVARLVSMQEEVRRIGRRQIDWERVDEAVERLLREFRKLKRLTVRCHSLADRSSQKENLQALLDRIDRKIAVCRDRLR